MDREILLYPVKNCPRQFLGCVRRIFDLIPLIAAGQCLWGACHIIGTTRRKSLEWQEETGLALRPAQVFSRLASGVVLGLKSSAVDDVRYRIAATGLARSL